MFLQASSIKAIEVRVIIKYFPLGFITTKLTDPFPIIVRDLLLAIDLIKNLTGLS